MTPPSHSLLSLDSMHFIWFISTIESSDCTNDFFICVLAYGKPYNCLCATSLLQFQRFHTLLRHSPFTHSTIFELLWISRRFPAGMNRLSLHVAKWALHSLAATIYTSEEDLMSFTNSLHKINLEIARPGAVCVNPPRNWWASDCVLSNDMKITAREQALLHLSFPSGKVYKKVLQCQQEYRKTPNLLANQNAKSCKNIRLLGLQRYLQFLSTAVLRLM